jgi:hypothetical protein
MGVRNLLFPTGAGAGMTRGKEVGWGCEGTSSGCKTQCVWGGGVRQLPGLKLRLRLREEGLERTANVAACWLPVSLWLIFGRWPKMEAGGKGGTP